jgi:hypothetical protein
MNVGSLLNDINILITKRVGDSSRLEHIKESVENNTQLYDSDRKYVDELIEKHLFKNEDTDDSPIEQTATIKEESPKKEEPEDIHTETLTETTSEGSFCGKCGASKKQDQNFCPKCGVGAISEEESFCPKCGNKVTGNNPCSNCNFSRQNQYHQNNPNGMSQRRYEWKSEGTTLVLTIILGIFGFGGIGHLYLGNLTRGIVILIVGIVLLLVAVFSMGIGLIILIPFAIWVVFDSRSQCRYYNNYLEQNQRPPW